MNNIHGLNLTGKKDVMHKEKKKRFKDKIVGDWVSTLPPVIQLSTNKNEREGTFIKGVSLDTYRTNVYGLHGHHKPISKMVSLKDLEE